MNTELTPEENQVVNLLLFGCESEFVVAHILDTSRGDIEDRLLSIRAKWQVISLEEIVKKAEKNGYGFYTPYMATRLITLDDLQFFHKFLGQHALVAITGSPEEEEKSKGVPWKDIQWALGMVKMIVSRQIEESARERYERMIRRLCANQTVWDEIFIIATKDQMKFRSN